MFVRHKAAASNKHALRSKAMPFYIEMKRQSSHLLSALLSFTPYSTLRTSRFPLSPFFGLEIHAVRHGSVQ
jgi:hypothetical protein